jgi:hypothetical protein
MLFGHRLSPDGVGMQREDGEDEEGKNSSDNIEKNRRTASEVGKNGGLPRKEGSPTNTKTTKGMDRKVSKSKKLSVHGNFLNCLVIV